MYLLVRRVGSAVTDYLAVDADSLVFGGELLFGFGDGPAMIGRGGSDVYMRGHRESFQIRDDGISRITCDDGVVPFMLAGDYAWPVTATAVLEPRATQAPVRVRAFPNPTNPATTIMVDGLSGRGSAVVYDVAGRHVRTLYRGAWSSSERLTWDGNSRRGAPVPSGVYFVRITSPTERRSVKIHVVR